MDNITLKDNILSFNQSGIHKKLASKIRKCRLMNRWSQKELCERAGVNFYTYKRFEITGKIELSRLCQVAVALGRAGELENLFEPPPVTSLDDLPDEPRIPKRGYTS